MKSRTPALLAALASVFVYARGADATTPVDFTKRNDPYAPVESVTLQKQKPAPNSTVQGKRVNPPAVEKQQSPLRDREAPIAVKEAFPKNVQAREARQPEVIEHKTSGFNHRPSTITTAGGTSKPPIVAKYQDSLTAASAATMARLPAMDGATSAKINRFVFRKNPPDTAAVVTRSAIVPAAGGSAPSR